MIIILLFALWTLFVFSLPGWGAFLLLGLVLWITQ